MPVHVRCPHCRTSCMVAEQYMGVPVRCGRCGRSFTTRAEACAQPMCLDLGAAGRFLVQHVVDWHHGERRELAVLAIADDSGLSETAAGLTFLVGNFLAGSEGGNAAASIRAAGLAIISNGQVSLGGEGGCRVYHHSGGRLMRLSREPLKLTAGDWLLLIGDGPPLDESALQREIAATPSAAALAEHLAGQGGTVLAVRCY